MDGTTILEYGGVLGFLLISLSVHESAHAWTAEKLGDPTGRMQGRVTLNPLAHLDPFLSVLLPLVTYYALGVPFGAGKPVPVNVLRLRHPRRDWMIVALAGPLSNLALALLFTAFWWGLDQAGLAQQRSMGEKLLRTAIVMNVVLAVFNLIPIPALDGSRVLGYLLPRHLAYKWYDLDRYGFVIVAGLLILPQVNPDLDVLRMIVNQVGNNVLGFLGRLTGLPL